MIKRGREGEEGSERAIIAVMNEGDGRSPPAIAQSPSEASVAPNFIIVTQSHRHSPPDKSEADLGSGEDQLMRSGFSGFLKDRKDGPALSRLRHPVETLRSSWQRTASRLFTRLFFLLLSLPEKKDVLC